MTLKKSDDAISPVIGVMLMLVITVVIAAVITMFATGMVTDTEPAPVAALDVKIYDYYQALPDVGGPDFHITHLSGDPIDTRDIELRFSWTHIDTSTGKSCTHYSTYSADDFKENYATKDTSGEWKNQFGNYLDSNQGERKQPLYVKTYVSDAMRKDYGSQNLDYYFGDVILTPGMKLTASADMLTSSLSNTGSQFMDVLFDNCKTTSKWDMAVDAEGYVVEVNTGGIMNHLEPGTAVDVMIIHLPSNKAIYDKAVIVE